jgi:hypothetical protein
MCNAGVAGSPAVGANLLCCDVLRRHVLRGFSVQYDFLRSLVAVEGLATGKEGRGQQLCVRGGQGVSRDV